MSFRRKGIEPDADRTIDFGALRFARERGEYRGSAEFRSLETSRAAGIAAWKHPRLFGRSVSAVTLGGMNASCVVTK